VNKTTTIAPAAFLISCLQALQIIAQETKKIAKFGFFGQKPEIHAHYKPCSEHEFLVFGKFLPNFLKF
jgi:hypothetical protein